ncbi:MAG: 3-deoxy-manno-octulosonate cytidylyltransferase [Planctomycetota bacterium]
MTGSYGRTTREGVLVVIPARLHSTRLPRKVILRETGKYLVQHVYERAQQIEGADAIVIATDHDEVREAVESFGGDVIMTSADHQSGSDRAAEVAEKRACDLIVNLQADEPELEPRDVAALIAAMREDEARMGTLVYPELSETDQADDSVVKAIVEDGWATDFRRGPTPGGLRHLGIYAFTPDFLRTFTTWPPSEREKSRRLEQMRAIDAGVPLRAVEAIHCGVGIDTPEDYRAFVERTPHGS